MHFFSSQFPCFFSHAKAFVSTFQDVPIYSITSCNSQLSTTEPTSLPYICSLACPDDSYHLSFQPHNPKDTHLSPEARTEEEARSKILLL